MRFSTVFGHGCGQLARCLCGIVAVTVFATFSLAQPAPDPPKPAVAPSSGDDFTGDKIILRSTMGGFKSLRGKREHVAPSGTALRINADERFTGESTDLDKTRLFVRVKSVRCVSIEDPAVRQATGRQNRELTTFVGADAFSDCPEGDLVRVGEAYEIDRRELDKYGFHRSGWTYGALLVPYKYHLDDRSFTAATTVGPYLGYRQGWAGIDAVLVGSIGLASLTAATEAPDGTTSTSTLQGFTVAIGLMSTVSKGDSPLQFGVLLGKDWAGSNSAATYEHEGELWIAAQIGFSFTK